MPDTAQRSSRATLRSALVSQRRDLVAACILYSCHQLGEALVPVVIGASISHAIAGGTAVDMAVWLGLLLADFVFLSVSFRLGARASMRAKQRVAHTARMWLTDRVVQPAGGIRNSPGDLLSRASSDAARVGAYAGMVAIAVAAGVVLIFTTVLLLGYSLLLGTVIITSTALLLVLQTRVAAALERRSAVEQKEQARATALAEDIVRGLRVLKGIGAERRAATEYTGVSREALRAALHATSSAATVAATGALLSGLYLAVLAGFGGYLAVAGYLGLGQLVSALGLARFVIGPMTVISGANAAYARAVASAGRIREVLDAEPAVEVGTDERTATAGDIPGLAFDSLVVEDDVPPLDADVPAGAMTGLVFATPTAAASVPDLLAREYDPQAGRIVLGTCDIAGLTLDELRSTMLVAPHDAVLLPGTIADNLHALDATDHQVAAASHAAFADQVIEVVPRRELTLVGDRGEFLSGGQRQRIALARAASAQPPVLVLHDPTTAVDAVTEDEIAHRIRALRAGLTTLVVSTGPAWLSRCDLVIFAGRHQTSIGTHANLLSSDAEYRAVVER